MFKVCRDEFSSLGYKIAKCGVPSWMIKTLVCDK